MYSEQSFNSQFAELKVCIIFRCNNTFIIHVFENLMIMSIFHVIQPFVGAPCYLISPPTIDISENLRKRAFLPVESSFWIKHRGLCISKLNLASVLHTLSADCLSKIVDHTKKRLLIIKEPQNTACYPCSLLYELTV